MLLSPTSLLPPDEEKRLLTLDYYDIQDSLREPVFDELVGLSARIFNLPISLLALVGADEVSYKARFGLTDFTYQARSEAVCALAIHDNKVVVFTDLSQPVQCQRLTAAAAAGVRAKGLHSYFGVPLRMPNQFVIGTFCVIGYEPRTLSPQELHVLEYLAHLMERIIVVRQACLTCHWLGAEHWQLVQDYITNELHWLTTRVNGQQAQAAYQVPTLPAILLVVIRRLNELSSILAEPLPGFA